MRCISFAVFISLHSRQFLQFAFHSQQFGAPPMIGYADSWLEGDIVKITMEYAEGGTLHDFIQKHKERRKPIPFSLITSKRHSSNISQPVRLVCAMNFFSSVHGGGCLLSHTHAFKAVLFI